MQKKIFENVFLSIWVFQKNFLLVGFFSRKRKLICKKYPDMQIALISINIIKGFSSLFFYQKIHFDPKSFQII